MWGLRLEGLVVGIVIRDPVGHDHNPVDYLTDVHVTYCHVTLHGPSSGGIAQVSNPPLFEDYGKDILAKAQGSEP